MVASTMRLDAYPIALPAEAGAGKRGSIPMLVGKRRALWYGEHAELHLPVLTERVIRLSRSQQQTIVARFEAFRVLEHVNIPRILDMNLAGDRLQLVMHTGRGGPLGLLSRPVAQHEAVEIGIQICNALNYLHHHPIFAGRALITPATTFLTTANRVKLTGIAALLGASRDDGMSQTPRGRGLRAEVYGIGVTLFYLLTGWRDTYRPDLPPLTELRPDLAPEFAVAIQRAMLPDPRRRWASSAELRYALLLLQDR